MMKWPMPAPTVMSVGLILAWVAFAGCGGGKSLDYETAMNLMREHGTEPLKTVFSSSPHYEASDVRIKEAYAKLTDAHVLECEQTAAAGTLCVPGKAGEALRQEGATDISVIAGRWVPATIVAIQRSGRSSATADVRMSFEPSEIYREFEPAFDTIQNPSAALALAETKQSKMMRATFQRYDDGWHLESLE